MNLVPHESLRSTRITCFVSNARSRVVDILEQQPRQNLARYWMLQGCIIFQNRNRVQFKADKRSIFENIVAL